MKIAFAFLAAMVVMPVSAQTAKPTVAQAMVDAALAADPQLSALTFHVTPAEGADNVIIASNIAPIGKKADDDDMKVIRSGVPEQGPNKAKTRYGVAMQLKTTSGQVIGSVNFGYKWKPGEPTSGYLARAQALRDKLATKIPDARSLMRPAL